MAAKSVSLVIAVDGSGPALRAIDAAARWARAGAQVRALLVNVRDLPETYGDFDRESFERIEREQGRRQDAVLLQADQHARACGLSDITVRAATGSAASEIVRVAEEVEADSIAMGMQGIGGGKGLVLGPVTQRVALLTKVPVLLAK